MQIERLSLENFRGIASGVIDFDPELTVIVGRNGAGKTSILDALAAMLLPVQVMWPQQDKAPQASTLPLSMDDRRSGRDRFDLKLEVSLEATPGEITEWTFEASTDDLIKGAMPPGHISLWANFQNERPARKRGQILAVYYRQDRGFVDQQIVNDATDITRLRSESLVGPLRAIGNLEAWWDKRDAQEARYVRDKDIKHRDPQLEVIRNLIKEIDGFNSVAYTSDATPQGLYFEKGRGISVHINRLSSGERSFIILLADLARRLQQAFQSHTLKDIRATVLIDEIELNLHPVWQSKILSTLRRVFPKCQFIITTHSPQIVSAIESKHVRVIELDSNGDMIVDRPLSTKGRTSNYLLEGVFGSTERSPEVDKLFDEFNTAIDAGESSKAKNLLNKISGAIDGDPPELLVLRNRLRRLSGDA